VSLLCATIGFVRRKVYWIAAVSVCVLVVPSLAGILVLAFAAHWLMASVTTAWDVRNVFIILAFQLSGLGLIVLLVNMSGIQSGTLERVCFTTAVTSVFVLFLVLRTVAVTYSHPLSSIGLTTARLWVNVWIGLGAAAVLLPISHGIEAVLVRQFGPSTFWHPKEQIARQSRGAHDLTLLLLSSAVLAPISEEVFFRGFTFYTFKRRYGTVRAAALSSALFTVLHLDPLWFPPIYCVGVVLAFLYDWRQSLVAPMIAHAAFNATNVLTMYLWGQG